MPGVNYVSSSLNRTRRKNKTPAEDSYPRLPPGYLSLKPRGMFAYLNPNPNHDSLDLSDDLTRGAAEIQVKPECVEVEDWNQEGGKKGRLHEREPLRHNAQTASEAQRQPASKLDFGFSWSKHALSSTTSRESLSEPYDVHPVSKGSHAKHVRGGEGGSNKRRKEGDDGSKEPWFLKWKAGEQESSKTASKRKSPKKTYGVASGNSRIINGALILVALYGQQRILNSP
ncbi:hypothetical protein L198_07525 [Cryptococcus wingfieldii CBS 7118]|uniref:Uncharacterized protein n=1 Tax=Cryptococcus wingfieldii CBS 7118 TaxID=1295528 RepID=A0A1E3IA18_9TREE|nr:hypothetical protein L198_07525 [Cryptococcus wingfieldii CBS 7118]ODN85444.1 hypothetical protein L198_07525 [Cryptococcus wingfieldii CBS 7118]